jgi:signal transduction histidine kinase
VSWWRGTVGRRIWSELLYVLLAAPLGLLGFVVIVVSFAFGLGLAVTFIGLPLLALNGRVARAFGNVDRRLARRLLGLEVPDPRPFRSGRGLFGWLQAALRDPVSWRARAYLVVKLPLALIGFHLALAFYGLGLFWLSYPLWWQLSGPGTLYKNVFLDPGTLVFRGHDAPHRQVAHQLTVHYGDHAYVDTWPRAVLLMLGGVALLLLAPGVVRGLAALHRLLIRGLLGRTRGDERVRELEAARTQVVDDSATTLRRIERDLHDGTQAQLAALALTLGQAKEKLEHRPDVPFDPEGALDLVGLAHQHAKEALVELRDLARGIHPPALDLGLDAALATLVARSAVPATLHADIPSRPDRAIETIAYFSVAELLANVAKHSQATKATVDVGMKDEMLVLRVRDDGVGGARIGGGSGLLGLRGRVRAVDGELMVHSPAGGPTVVDVQLPVHS